VSYSEKVANESSPQIVNLLNLNLEIVGIPLYDAVHLNQFSPNEGVDLFRIFFPGQAVGFLGV
jgi:hypothetical protein